MSHRHNHNRQQKTETPPQETQTTGHDFSNLQGEGWKLRVVERFQADPSAAARNDPLEICTRMDGRLFFRGQGPQPPLHYNCRCTRGFFAYWYILDE